MNKLKQIHRGHIPFVRFLLACMGGIAAASLIDPQPTMYTIITTGAFLMLVATVTTFAISRRTQSSIATSMCFFLTLFLFSWGRTWAPHPHVDRLHFSRYDNAFLIGYFQDEPQERDRHIRGLVRITQGMDSSGTVRPHRGLLQITIEKDTGYARLSISALSPDAWALSDTQSLGYGSRILLPANHRWTSPPRNPGEMDYAGHLAKNNCWHQLYIREHELHGLTGIDGNPIRSYALRLRETMVDKFRRYIPDPDALAIASTLILGYRAELSRELLDVYSATGTIHVLSVSGMHVVIVFWLLARLLFWMDFYPWLQWARFPLLLVAIWGYALLTGLSPSVLRAAMMLSFVLWANAVNRVPRTYNSIGASAFFLVLYEPKLLLNIGFQLSYLAVLGIVFLYPLIQFRFGRRWTWLKPIGDYSSMSVSAQAGAFPLAMFYFQQFPVYFLLANLVVVLPASVIMYLGFALLLLPETGMMTGLLTGAGVLLSGLIVEMNRALTVIQGFPGARLTGLETGFWQCVLIYGGMLTLVLGLVKRSGSHFVAALVLIGAVVASGSFRSWEKWRQQKVVIHQMRSAVGISITGRGQAVLYSNLSELNHSALQFSVLPYLRTFGPTSGVQFVQAGEIYQNKQVYIAGGLIQVGARRLFVYDNQTGWPRGEKPGRNWDPVLDVDVLLIRENPPHSLAEIMKHIQSRRIVLDGSNHSKTIERLETEIAHYDLESYVLKDNFAYVWVLD